MSEELKPCPFCGGHPTPDYSAIIGEDKYHFHCQSADCPAWPNVSGDTEESAIAAWNTRADTALIEVERDAAGNVLICTGIAPMTKAYGTLPEAVQYSGMSRTSIYEALKRGDLKARKAGRRTLISFADLETYLASLPTYQVAK